MNVYSLQGTVISCHNRKKAGGFRLKGIAISLLLLLAGMLAGATATAQQVTLNEKNAPLKKIFQLIRKQTGCIFFYEKDALDGSAPVTIQVKNTGIREVLELCLRNQQLSYIISGNNIGIKRKLPKPENTGAGPAQEPPAVAAILISGQVMDTLGRPKEGVTVINVPRGGQGKTFTATNADGVFEIYGQKGDRLQFTAVGHQNAEIRVTGEIRLHITLRVAPIEMNAVVIDDVNMSKKRVPFTDTINMTHRTHLNLGQLLQGSIPGLTLQNSSQSEQTLESIDFDGAIMAGSRVPTVDALRAHYQQYQSAYAERGFPTFEAWINQFKGHFKFNYRTTVNSNGLVPQLRGVSGFNGNTSGMLVVIDGFPQDGFPATYPMANIESVKVIKDPEELGKWGPRAAGGIIMITSKRAAADKIQVSYASNFYYSPAPRFNRSRMRLPSSADLIDYLNAASDSGFLKLGSKDYPITAFNLNTALRTIQRLQQGSITQDEYNARMDSLGRLSNESQLRLLQQDGFNQNQTLTLSGGAGPWRFRAAGGYNTSRSFGIGEYARMLNLNMNNDFSLFRHKLRAQWFFNVMRNTGRSGITQSQNDLQPYQLIVDPVSGEYIYDYSAFHPDANAAIRKYGYLDEGVNMLEDARLNSTMSKNVQLQSRLNTDWDLTPSLKWSASFQYNLAGNNVESFQDAASSTARQLLNSYGSPVFDNNNTVTGIDFYVPLGGIMKRSESRMKGWNLRTALLFSKNFGSHQVAASLGGGGYGDASYMPAYQTMYGYNKQTGQSQPVRLPDPDPAAGITNLYALPEPFFENTMGQLVYPGTLLTPQPGDSTVSRGLNWNGSLSYAYDSTWLLNGRLNATLTPNYGHPTPYTNMVSYGADAGWRLNRMAFFNAPAWLSNVTLSAGIEGMSLPALPTQISASRSIQRNWQNYGIWVTGFNPAEQSGQRSYNVYEKLTIGLNRDRLMFDVAFNTLRTENGDSEQPVSGETLHYVSAGGKLRLRDGLLHAYAGYNYSLDGQPQLNMRVLYDIARETYFNSALISKLSADFVLQHISAIQGMELMTGTNTPLSGGGFSMAVNNRFGLLPPKVRNLEAHTTLGLDNDRYLLDLRFYQKNTAGLNNNIPVPTDPATGLAAKVSYSEIVTKGVEAYLHVKAVQTNTFRYELTLNGAYNRNIARSVPVVNFSATPNYLRAYRNGYSIENIWSYRWAGLDAAGSPGIYDAKGQRTTTPDTATLMNALVYSGVVRPPFTGGFIQEWDYKGFFARVTLLLSFGHVMREYKPAPSREEERSVLIRDRWRKPGDEAFTDIPAMSANAGFGSTRRLITQYSTNSIMPADNIRLQEVQIGWQGAPGKILRSYLIKDLTLSLQVMNLALWTRNRLGVDPEAVANTGQIGLPMPRQYSFSVNMRF